MRLVEATQVQPNVVAPSAIDSLGAPGLLRKEIPTSNCFPSKDTRSRTHNVSVAL